MYYEKPFVFLSHIYITDEHSTVTIFFDSNSEIIDRDSYLYSAMDNEVYEVDINHIRKGINYDAYSVFEYTILQNDFILYVRIENNEKISAKFKDVVFAWDIGGEKEQDLQVKYGWDDFFYYSKKEKKTIYSPYTFQNNPQDIPLTYIATGEEDDFWNCYHKPFIIRYDSQTNLLFYRFQESDNIESALKKGEITEKEKDNLIKKNLVSINHLIRPPYTRDLDKVFFHSLTKWKFTEVKTDNNPKYKRVYKALGIKSKNDMACYDLFAQNRDIPTIKQKYFIFDTETTGLINDSSEMPRLVQLAWAVYANDGSLIYEESEIIRPNKYTIPKDAIKIHGITNEKAKEEGLDLRYVMLKFQNDLSDSNCVVVGHNLEFDMKMIKHEFDNITWDKIPEPVNVSEKEYSHLQDYNYNIDDYVLKNFLLDKKHICTMKASIGYCAIDGKKGYKWPKLSELHNKLFSDDFYGAHDALSDVKATAKCFFQLRKKGIIETLKGE